MVMVSFPITDNEGVIPIDKPTVPQAEVISKNICINDISGSDNERTKHPIKINETVNNNTK